MNKKMKITLLLSVLGSSVLIGSIFFMLGGWYCPLSRDSEKSGKSKVESVTEEQSSAQVDELNSYKEALEECQASQVEDSMFKLTREELDKRVAYKDEDLGLSFVYPAYWGEVKKNKNEEKIILSFPSLGGEIAIDATDSDKKIADRGSYWGDVGFDIKDQVDIDSLCKRFSLSVSCSVFKNDNGIRMVKEVSTPGTEGGPESVTPSTQYYFYNPNGEYEGVSMSALRLKNREYFAPIERDFEEMVQSIRFIDSDCPDYFKSFSDLKEGDCYGGMIVESYKKFYAEGGKEGKAMFSAKDGLPVVLSGKYEYYAEDYAFLGGLVCFYADKGTILPTIKSDYEREPWLCFSNQDKAKESFGPIGSTGRARISIDDYDYIVYGSEVWNKATLKEVMEKY